MNLTLFAKILLIVIIFTCLLAYIVDLISSSVAGSQVKSIESKKYNGNSKTRFIIGYLFQRKQLLTKIVFISPVVIILCERFYTMLEMHIYKVYEDFLFFYAVGSAIYQRLNPYLGIPNPTNLESSLNFPYLPNSFVFLAPLGLIEIDVAFIVFRLIGITSVFLFCVAIVRLLGNYQYLHRITLFVFISIFGLFFDVLLGNISTITITLIAWFIVYLKENNQIKASVFLALSTIKPTLCIFFFVMLIAKREFRVLSLSLVFSGILVGLGLVLAGVNPFDINDLYSHFILPWRNAINTNIDNNMFGSEYLSKSRIDVGVIGARIFRQGSQFHMASLLSTCMKLSLVLAAFWKFFALKKAFNNYKLSSFKGLEELLFFWNVSLFSLLNIICNYSQNTNNSMLVFPLIFLLVYKCFIYKYPDLFVDSYINNNFRWNLLWTLSIFCVFVHTVVSYSLVSYLFGYDDNYLQSISVGFTPNITVVLILIIIACMPIPSMRMQAE